MSNNFDGLRLMAALMVLFSHQFALSGRPEPTFIGAHTLGTLGVLIFFSISGFLVAASWNRDPYLPRFLIRRFLRLWPALAVCVVACLALASIFLLDPIQHRRDFIAFLSNIYFVWDDANFFTRNRVGNLNGSLWTIQTEVGCYLILGCVAVLSANRLKWAALVLSVLTLFFQWNDTAASLDLKRFFLAGVLLACFPRMQNHRSVLAACAISVLCLVLSQPSLALLFVVPTVTVWTGCRSWPFWRSAGKFGDFSYGTYLWAWPVQQTLILMLGAKSPLLWLLACSLVGTLALAAASWHGIESPALKLKARLRGRQPNAEDQRLGAANRSLPE